MPVLFLFLNAAAEVYRRCDMPSRALACLRRCNAVWNNHLDNYDYNLYACVCQKCIIQKHSYFAHVDVNGQSAIKPG
jgi:hypothetical protein